MLKRFGFLFLANLAVFLMLSIVLTVVQMVFGVNFGTMTGQSLNIGTLFVFSMVVGFTGSIISLLMSKSMAKMSMGLTMIDTNNPNPGLEAWLVDVIRRQCAKADLPMPEVGIYQGEPNAFATGASQSSSLVAVSTGLLELMNREEVEAVIAHELSHVKNGDMVTQTLLQGVRNTFVVFASRLIGWVVDRVVLRNEEDRAGIGYYVTSMVLDIVFGMLAGIVVAYFSRYRCSAWALSNPTNFRAPSRASGFRAASVRSLRRTPRLRTASPRWNRIAIDRSLIPQEARFAREAGFFRSGEKPSIIAADDPLRSLDNESLRAALVSFCFGRRRRRGASGSVPREDRVGDPAADAHARAKRPGEKKWL